MSQDTPKRGRIYSVQANNLVGTDVQYEDEDGNPLSELNEIAKPHVNLNIYTQVVFLRPSSIEGEGWFFINIGGGKKMCFRLSLSLIGTKLVLKQ